MGPNYGILREALLTASGSVFISGDFLKDSVSSTGQELRGDGSFTEPGAGPGTQEALNNQLPKVT